MAQITPTPATDATAATSAPIGATVNARNNLRFNDLTGYACEVVAAMPEDFKHGEPCRICYEEYEAHTKISTTSCNHAFCTECLEHWFTTSTTCPLCRQQVKLYVNATLDSEKKVDLDSFDQKRPLLVAVMITGQGHAAGWELLALLDPVGAINVERVHEFHDATNVNELDQQSENMDDSAEEDVEMESTFDDEEYEHDSDGNEAIR